MKGAGRASLLAQALLVLAVAALQVVPRRDLDFAAAAALQLVATFAFLCLARAMLRGTYRPSFAQALLFAVVLRSLALLLRPQLSEDIYRYLFEGHLVLHGLNPYVVAPAAEQAAYLRDAWWPLITYKELPAVYPPAVEYALALGTWIHPTPLCMKGLFGALDLLTFLALWRWLPRLGLPPQRAILHGYCPLLVLEFAGEGHSDSLAVLFLVLALACAARPVRAAVLLAIATAGKLWPAVLLPFVARRSWRALVAFALVLILLYLPFLAPPAQMFHSTLEYAARWRSNDSLFNLVYGATDWLLAHHLLPGHEAQRVAKWPLLLLGLLLLAHAWRRQWTMHATAAAFVLFFVAFTPTLHPWYVAILVPFLCIYPDLFLLAFTGTVYLAYHVLPVWVTAHQWHEVGWVKLLEYAPFYVGLVQLLLAARRGNAMQLALAPAPWAPPEALLTSPDS